MLYCAYNITQKWQKRKIKVNKFILNLQLKSDIILTPTMDMFR